MINLILFILISMTQIFSANIKLDNFEQPTPKTVDKLIAPINWSDGNKKDGKVDYYLVQEDNNTFLRGEFIQGTKGKVIYLKKQIKLKDTPYLSWKWRARKFPNLQSLDGKEEPDNVATVYVLFKKGWSNYLIKYDWSQFNCKTAEDGSPVSFKSKSSAAFWLIYIKPTRCTNSSIKCCSDPTDKWVSEKVNLIDDFKFLFKKDWLPEYIEGIGVLVDGDDTNTAGVSADFNDFILSSE